MDIKTNKKDKVIPSIIDRDGLIQFYKNTIKQMEIIHSASKELSPFFELTIDVKATSAYHEMMNKITAKLYG